ncbi:MAG: lipoate--protein ligase family protein [Chitinophagales bacterium]
MRRLLYSKRQDPFFNLALEELIVRKFPLEHCDILVIYSNNPCIVLGKNQNVLAEVSLSAIKDQAIIKSRRISGGGTVVHDLGNINFSFFSKHHIHNVNNYSSSVGWMVDCLRQLGVQCHQNERNAIFLSNGKKISGSAQFSTSNGILSHFSLLYNSNLDFVRYCLSKNDSFQMTTKASPSVRSEVDNLKNYLAISQEEFIDEIIGFWKPDEVLDIAPYDSEITKLMESKYSNLDYVFNTACSGVIQKNENSITINQGIIESELRINNMDFVMKSIFDPIVLDYLKS